jgi:hypothetical protein
MSSAGAAHRTAVSISNARAEASRRNGAKSRGPRTEAGKARSAQNALKHGMRAQKHIVLPDEDAAEFAALEAAMIEELAPAGALQTVLARRVAVAAWRLARADRVEADLFAERSYGADPNPGLALIRDGNRTRSFETLLRYRGAAMAEFWRALRTLKALQAEQALDTAAAPAARPLAAHPREIHPMRRAPRPPLVHRPPPDEPKRGAAPQLQYGLTEPPAPARALHEPAAPWLPIEPAAPWVPNEPEPGRQRQDARGSCSSQDAAPPPRANEPGSLGKPQHW